MMGKWYVVEVIEHRREASWASPTLPSGAQQHFVIDACPIVHLRALETRSGGRQQAGPPRISLLWEEAAGSLEYTFWVSQNRGPGVWNSDIIQNGKLRGIGGLRTCWSWKYCDTYVPAQREFNLYLRDKRSPAAIVDAINLYLFTFVKKKISPFHYFTKEIHSNLRGIMIEKNPRHSNTDPQVDVQAVRGHGARDEGRGVAHGRHLLHAGRRGPHVLAAARSRASTAEERPAGHSQAARAKKPPAAGHEGELPQHGGYRSLVDVHSPAASVLDPPRARLQSIFRRVREKNSFILALAGEIICISFDHSVKEEFNDGYHNENAYNDTRDQAFDTENSKYAQVNSCITVSLTLVMFVERHLKGKIILRYILIQCIIVSLIHVTLVESYLKPKLLSISILIQCITVSLTIAMFVERHLKTKLILRFICHLTARDRKLLCIRCANGLPESERSKFDNCRVLPHPRVQWVYPMTAVKTIICIAGNESYVRTARALEPVVASAQTTVVELDEHPLGDYLPEDRGRIAGLVRDAVEGAVVGSAAGLWIAGLEASGQGEVACSAPFGPRVREAHVRLSMVTPTEQHRSFLAPHVDLSPQELAHLPDVARVRWPA
ncbi:unnamed protein product, partial [Trichogramma brassicae]